MMLLHYHQQIWISGLRFNEYAKLAKNWNKLHDELEDLLIQYGLSQEDIGVYDYEEMEDYESE